jgi:membrane protein
MTRRAARGAYDHNIFFLASAITFDALIAAIPFVLLLLGVLGYVVNSRLGGINEVHILFERFVPSHGSGPRDPLVQAEQMVTRVVASRLALSTYAVPFFLWFAVRFFGSVRAALNAMFDTPSPHGFFVGKGVDLLLVAVTLVWLTAITALTRPAGADALIWRLAASSVEFMLGVGLFYVVYTLAPARRTRPESALIAATVAALAFEAAQKVYTIYVARFATIDRLISDANAIAVALFILWIYYSACVFLLGAEVGVVYEQMQKERDQPAAMKMSPP